MGIVTGVVLYVMIWWSVIFCILPLGMSKHYEEQGTHIAPGAPSKVNMKQKFLLTTVISFVIWCILFALIEMDVLDVYGTAHPG